MSLTETIPHQFDNALALVGDADGFACKISSDYQNMVGPFGGMTAAMLLQSVLAHPEREGSPVALTVNYLGQIKGSEVQIKPRLIRTNRSNQHWVIELHQGGEIYCSASCVFAKRLDTWQNTELKYPDAPEVESVSRLGEFPGMMPWLKQYDMRFIKGSLFDKFDEKAEALSESLLWLSDSPPRKLDFASLTALADAFFPRIIIRRRKMVPFGTVSLTIHFHVTEEQLANIDTCSVLGQARSSKFSNQYFDQTAELWSTNETLLATTSQMVYYKD